MEYITHHRYKGLALCGETVNIPYGSTLGEEAGSLIWQEKEICFAHSENSKSHFAWNGDSQGLARGPLTYAIAYAPRKAGQKGYRFSEDEAEMLRTRWPQYLRQDVPVILFNSAFFAAPILELREMAAYLRIKVRRR